ncbi:GrpB family protein [Kribbella sp. NPDC051770]|uniref:GrpB family protein n=1 Tax=Kribbella sp. NPDC051770 TaxID=3155413 RepID=UPI003427E222
MTTIADYDPTWPTQYAEMAAHLHPILGDPIEHIGSTAVPGLAAKPVIDIAAAPDRPVDDQALAALGFQHNPHGPPGRRTYTRVVDGVLTHNLHVFPTPAWPELNQRLLRDHLRATPEAVRRYAALKRQLAAEGLTGFDYTKAKTDLIQELTDTARAHHGLPSVPVWES